MKNKGFTLIELLAVITILSVILILIIPSVSKVILTSKDTVYEAQVNEILSSAYDWSLKNPSYLPNINEEYYITLALLKQEGLISSDIKDPKTKELFPDNLVVRIKNIGKSSSKDKYSKKSGDYLYTVLIDELSDPNYNSNNIKITLDSLTPNSEGNYVLNVNVNDSLFDIENIKYTVYKNSSIDNDLTSKVIKNIMHENVLVSSIDKTKAGIYYVNYTVIDSNGYATLVTLSIIITDDVAPEINLPTENKISVNIEEFDLKEGVSCIDNSGICEIKVENIEEVETGKYVVTYTAQDPSGNLSTKKRTITKE